MSEESKELVDVDIETNTTIEWNDAIETLIKEQGEKALSYNWLHTRCEKKYSRLNNYIPLPVIGATITFSCFLNIIEVTIAHFWWKNFN